VAGASNPKPKLALHRYGSSTTAHHDPSATDQPGCRHHACRHWFHRWLPIRQSRRRREVFVPLPQGKEVTSSELVLVIDDSSAHEVRRNLEVLVNDRSAIAIALDGKSPGRTIRVPLVKAKDGFLKLSFLYSGAATPDLCIDVRYVGDSLTIRSETTIEIGVGNATVLDVPTTLALMPREEAIARSSSAPSAG